MNQRLTHFHRRRTIVAMVLLSLFASLLPISTPVASAVSSGIVISQVYGGGGNTGATLKNDFIELFNRGSVAVNIAGWSVQYASSGGSTWLRTNLSGVIQPGQYFLVQQALGAGGTTNLPTPDATGSIAMSATSGKVALVSNQTNLTCGSGAGNCFPNADIVDFVGFGSAANNFEGSGPTSSLSNTTAALRAGNGCTETDNNSSDFATGAPAPRNTAAPFNPCGGPPPPTNPTGVGNASPSFLAAGAQTLLTVAVTPGQNPASTGLSVSADLSAIGGSVSASFFDNGSNGDAIPGDNTFSLLVTVDPGTTPGAKALAATISDAQGRSGSATVNLVVEPPVTAIHAVQGASHQSPMAGEFVAIQGIVIAASNNGFWVQETNPDTDDATSEGIFVFTSSAPGVADGAAVKVTGTVKEFRPGGASSANLTITELDNPLRNVTVLSSGNLLPAPVVIDGGRVPPTAVIEDDAMGDVETSGIFDPANDGIDFYESLEGMRVQVEYPVAVGPTSSFGEIPVVGNGSAAAGPDTNRGGVYVSSADFNPERIHLDDVLTAMPIVAVGAQLGPVIGVLDYSFGNFKLLATASPTVIQDTLAPEAANAAPSHQLRIATFNVENLAFMDLDAKFAQLANLIVLNLGAPDVLTLEEIQDNNGATNNGEVDADQTLTKLITAIQSAGGPLYAYRQISPVNNEDGGAPGGNIRVGFLFNPSRVTFVDRPGGTATASTGVVAGANGPELTFSPGRIDPTNLAFDDSRKPLAGEFQFQGDTVFVIANHFNSKGGDEPLFGRFQPPTLVSEAQRLAEAQVVNNFVDSILALDPAANIVVAGDFNDFQFSAPLATLKGGVLTNLMDSLPPAEQYTYVFEGNSQALDHTLVSAAVAGRPFIYDVVHTNAEFPAATRASDHDPQVAALCVDATPPVLQVTVTPNTLWPPNHKYVTVKATLGVVDNADAAPQVTVAVTSSDPDNGLGDGDTANDIVVVDNTTFKLRAERAGGKAGRTYTIAYTATDACGNVGTASAVVLVPANQGKQGEAVDLLAAENERGPAIYLPLVNR